MLFSKGTTNYKSDGEGPAPRTLQEQIGKLEHFQTTVTGRPVLIGCPLRGQNAKYSERVISA